MATLATSFRAIGSSETNPAPISEVRAGHSVDSARIKLELQRDPDLPGGYAFSYRSASRSPLPRQNLFVRLRAELAWLILRVKHEFFSCLDIEISCCDALVQVDTFGPDLFWSLTKDAVTTLHDHSDLYGELLYWDGSDWKTRDDFGALSCRRIRFKAKHNSGGTMGERHKFSYNVLLRDGSGSMVEYEIDPEIQNPKV